MVERTLELDRPGFRSHLWASHLTPCTSDLQMSSRKGNSSSGGVNEILDGTKVTSCHTSAQNPPVTSCHSKKRFLPGLPEAGITWPHLLFPHLTQLQPSQSPCCSFNTQACFYPGAFALQCPCLDHSSPQHMYSSLLPFSLVAWMSPSQ